MEQHKPASDKIPSGNGATPDGDCSTPKEEHAKIMDQELTPDLQDNTDLDPFKRKPSIARTPVKLATSPDTGSDIVDLTETAELAEDSTALFFRRLLSQDDRTELPRTFDTTKSKYEEEGEDEFQLPKKRKRNKGTSPELKLLHEIEPSRNISLLIEKAAELIEFGRKNNNVHRQVKNLAGQIKGMAEKILLDYRKAELTRLEEKRDSDLREESLHKRITELENSKKTASSTTCESCGKSDNTEVTSLDGMYLEDIKSVRECVARTWRANTYKCTNVIERDHIGKLPDHIVILSDRLYIDRAKTERVKSKANKIEREVADIFPELESEEPSPCQGGYSITLEELTSCKIRGVNKNTEKKRIVSIMFRKDADGDNLEKLYGLLLETKNALREAGTTQITVVAPAYLDATSFRKLVECIFKDTNTLIEIIFALGSFRSYAGATREIQRNRGEAVIIETNQGRDYNLLLNKLKEGLSPTEAKDISTVRKTTNGNLLLQIKKDATGNDLKNKVEEVIGIKGVTRTADGVARKTLFLRGIDSMATLQEVREALLFSYSLEHPEQIKLALNKNLRGGQSAVITMNAMDAKGIMALRTLRIGFSDCYIEERIRVDRCHKCWKFGHNARSCEDAETDLSDRCYKCGQVGHHKAQCTSEKDFCLSCQMEGHQAWTGGCKLFRAALAKEKAKKKMLKNG